MKFEDLRTNLDFANDDISGAFQRNQKSQIVEEEIPFVAGDWETFFKGLFMVDQTE